MARKQFRDLRDTALEVLDFMEEKRINGVWSDDGDIRVIEASVAHYVGFTCRSQWVVILDADEKSKRVKALAEQALKGHGETFIQEERA